MMDRTQDEWHIQAPIKHRMTRRLHGWDYCQRAIYMVTVTLADRTREWLGSLAKNGEARDAGEAPAENGGVRNAGEWTIAPTPYGNAVLEALDEMPLHYPQVRILARQLMPEHFHFIVFVTAPLPKPLGALVRGFKAGATKRWKNLAKNGEARNGEARNGEARNGEARNGEARNGEARNGYARNGDARDNKARAGTLGCSVPGHFCPDIPAWSEGFQDTILFREGQLAAMTNYIHDNPDRLAEKRANPDLFRRVANLALPLDGGRLIGRFEAIGNRHLLRRPLHQVQCSRSFFAYHRIPKPGGGLKIARNDSGEPIVEHTSPDYEARLEAALDAAAHGAVVLSPCISDGERQIARETLLRNLPLVTLQNKGFSPLQKPPGRYFEACAAGRLLMMAPAAWPYTTQEKPMTRFDATALNRLCQWLAGEDAVEINYHGMQPGNIDGLARAAAMVRC